MRIIFISILFIIACAACSPVIKETIVDAKSGEIVGGYTDKGYFPLTKGLRKKDISETETTQWRAKGVGLLYTYDEEQLLRAIEIEKAPDLMTAKGLKTGDSMEKAKKLYGKPLKERDVNYDIGGKTYFICEASFYRGLSIYYDREGKIIVISVGKNLIYQ